MAQLSQRDAQRGMRRRTSDRLLERRLDARVLAARAGGGGPDGRAHGADESLHAEELERICLAEALLLRHLAT